MMKKPILLFSVCALLMACGGGKKDNGAQIVELKGGVNGGGIFKINEVEDFKTFYPLSINDATSHRIASQIYQGLLKFDQKTLDVVPCLAEKMDINADATVFTFHLKKGVKFHSDDCFGGGSREMTADDVKYCLDRICEANPENKVYWLFQGKVKGSEEYYQSTVSGKPLQGGVSGIKAVDDHTVEITLNFSFSAFPKIIAHSGCWIYPKEAWDRYKSEMRTHCVGTGPFVVKQIKEGNMVLLEKNTNYWETDEHGNKLPYLQGVKVTFYKEKKTELEQFRKQNLDMVWKLPVDEIPSVLASLDDAKKGVNIEFEIQQSSALSIQFYGFQTQSEVFKDKRIRQAFNYAIDREKLVMYTLQGEGDPAVYGFVPPFGNYPHENIHGFTFDPDRARALMADAGYPSGRGFPNVTLQLNSGGTTNELLAQAVKSQLEENLGVKVSLELMPLNQLIENFELGKAEFWRSAWIADYPDPENFLNLFYGKNVPSDPNAKSYINFARYINPQYDSTFEAALKTTDEKQRLELFAKCDQIIVDEAPVMPIYYDNYIRLVQLKVRNLPINAMEYRDLSRVWFAKEDEKEK